jgi:hypothetical protein
MIDNHPKIRQAKKLARRLGNRPPADRILIVSEGSKTEPHYFEEIRVCHRLPTANVYMIPSQDGTSPNNVVNFAYKIFMEGDKHKRIPPKAFEKVFAVFDRDEHTRYFEGLDLAKSINNRNLRNDQRRSIEFKSIASVPNFELWLLLHFQDCQAPMDRHEVVRKLKTYLPAYEKEQGNHYTKTKRFLSEATHRAEVLTEKTTAWNGTELYTDIHLVVNKLINFKK